MVSHKLRLQPFVLDPQDHIYCIHWYGYWKWNWRKILQQCSKSSSVFLLTLLAIYIEMFVLSFNHVLESTGRSSLIIIITRKMISFQILLFMEKKINSWKEVITLISYKTWWLSLQKKRVKKRAPWFSFSWKWSSFVETKLG